MQPDGLEISSGSLLNPCSDNRPVVLSIAAWDPSGSAGLAADIKTFEQFRVKGMGVVTALTAQTEDAFYYYRNLDVNEIFQQLKPIFQRYHPQWIKIGMCDHSVIDLIAEEVIKHYNDSFIIWDPILASSTGYSLPFAKKEVYLSLIKKVRLIIPNLPEAEWLVNRTGLSIAEISGFTRILLKGGHSENHRGVDILYYGGKEQMRFEAEQLAAQSKRGTGCVFSSALTALLANGYELNEAVVEAKKYMLKILNSNTGKWAYHVA